jgi:hypothetical protein
LCKLQNDFNQADQAVNNFLVDIGLNPPEDFVFEWDANSDAYRLLYQQPMTPFVNSQGEDVDIYKIMAKRCIRLKDHEVYKLNQEKARVDVTRKKQFMLAWDTFRLNDSYLLLPFIDHTGHKVTMDEIEKARDLHEGVRKSNTFYKNNPKALRVLKKKKQVIEHKLMMFKEEQKEIQVGKLFLSKFAIIPSKAKQFIDNNNYDVRAAVSTTQLNSSRELIRKAMREAREQKANI